MVRIRAFRLADSFCRQTLASHSHLLECTAVLDRPVDNLPCNLIGASAEGSDYFRHPFAFDGLPDSKPRAAMLRLRAVCARTALNRITATGMPAEYST